MSSLLSHAFFHYAILGILLTAIATSLIGCYIVVRRMVFVAGGVTHSSFAGLGLGFYMGGSPLLFALVAAVLSGLGVELVSRPPARLREDSAIAAIWSLGMAIGVIFTFLTPGYTPSLSTFLFGNILLVSKLDLLLLALFVVVSIPLLVRFYYPLLYISFDSEYGATRGVPVATIRYLLMVWICIGLVLSIRAVGIMMLMSMVTLPQMTANLFTQRFHCLLVYTTFISIASGLVALFVSFWLSLPTGACTILILVFLYLTAHAVTNYRRYGRIF